MEPSNTDTSIQSNRSWYFFALLYLFFDYVRPQALLPILGVIRPSLLTTIFLLLFILKKGRGFFFRNTQVKLIWLFVAILGILVPFSHNRRIAFYTFRTILLYLPFIISLLVCIDSMKRLRHFLFFLMLIMIYMSVYMITHHGMGPGNYFMDENDVSLFIDMLLPYGYFLFIQERIRWRKILYGIALFLCVGAVVVSFSRGGFVGLIVASAVIWLFSPRKIVTVLILAVLGIGMFLFGDQLGKLGKAREHGGRSGSYWNEMSTFADAKENTAAQRILFWHAAIRMWKDYPFGVGGSNFPLLHEKYKLNKDRINRWGRPAHSLWFTLLPETGVEGVLVFMLLVFANIRDALFIKKHFQHTADPDDKFLYFLSLGFLSSLAGFFAAASFISVLYYAHIWYISGLIAATAAVARARLAQNFEEGQQAPEIL